MGSILYDRLSQKYSFGWLFFSTELHESLGLVVFGSYSKWHRFVGSNIGGLKDYIIDGYQRFLFEAQNAAELIIPSKSNMSRNVFLAALKYKSNVVSCKLMQKLEGPFFIILTTFYYATFK